MMPNRSARRNRATLPALRGSRRGAAVLVLAGVLFGCGSTDQAADQLSESSTVDDSGLLAPAEFEEYISEDSTVPLVNVHIPYEGHIDGTDEFVPFEEISQWSALPADKSAPIALYCRSGNMSGDAAAELADLGYTNVIDLEGGMNAWAAAGMTVVDEEPAESLNGADLTG